MVNRPVVNDWMQEYVIAFSRLSRQRHVADIVGPISYESLRAYLDLFGAPNGVEEFIECITEMDSVYLTIVHNNLGSSTSEGVSDGTQD